LHRKIKHHGRRIDGVEGPPRMRPGERLRLQASTCTEHQDSGVRRCVFVDEDRSHAVHVAVRRYVLRNSIGIRIDDTWILKRVRGLGHNVMVAAVMQN
jgi:hypothetical protein